LLEDIKANLPQSGVNNAITIINTITTFISIFHTLTIISTIMTSEGLLITFSDGTTCL